MLILTLVLTNDTNYNHQNILNHEFSKSRIGDGKRPCVTSGKMWTLIVDMEVEHYLLETITVLQAIVLILLKMERKKCSPQRRERNQQERAEALFAVYLGSVITAKVPETPLPLVTTTHMTTKNV